jgi:SNF2 family DNA or RNA helicase
MTLQEFLTQFGESLAQRVTQTCAILHDPVRDAGEHPDLDRRLATLLRPCYPAQAEAIKALARAFFHEGERAAYLCGEMGVGKCQMALGLLALAPRPLRTLVMCPPHLVPKWQREAEAVLPAVRVVPLSGPESLGFLCRLAAARRSGRALVPPTPEVWVVGRERTKLHHTWRPAVGMKLQARRDSSPSGRDSKAGPLVTWRDPACTRCGQLLVDTDGMPLPLALLGKKHVFCPHCGDPAFTADRRGPRRYALAEFIKRHLRGAFDLFVADEVHELKGESTGQGNAFGALATACTRTLALTGTLLGGYADNLFFLLWRSHPRAMAAEGLDYRRVQQWMERYGILERITRIRPDDGWDARTVRGKNGRTTVRRKPGISPLILGKHLLPTTVFLRLADVAEALPPYEERVVSLSMSPDLAEAYHGLASSLLSHVREALASGSRHLLSLYLQSLLCYPDQAAFRSETVHDPRTKEILGHAPQVPGPLPKEQELLDICAREVREAGRRLLVYVTFTETRDITPRLQGLLSRAGFRVAVLKGSVEPTRREAWIQERVQEGIEVLLVNPELVKTGLDLYDFPTFIFYETGYSIYTLRQAARRAWRIGQRQPCRVIFLVYDDTMQSKALTLIATKLEASLAVEGELSADGLSVLADTSDSLVLELARALVNQHIGATESAEAVWARLRKRDIEQVLTLTAARPAPSVTTISESVERIGEKLLIVDLIDHPAPRKKRVSRVEVKEAELQQLLQERPHLAQLALF